MYLTEQQKSTLLEALDFATMEQNHRVSEWHDDDDETRQARRDASERWEALRWSLTVKPEPAPSAATLLQRCESFIAGFEDDETQEGVTELLADLRAAIAAPEPIVLIEVRGGMIENVTGTVLARVVILDADTMEDTDDAIKLDGTSYYLNEDAIGWSEPASALCVETVAKIDALKAE